MQARTQFLYEGVYVDPDGRAISPSVMMQSLVEHLTRWSKVITKHNLIILEVHSVSPKQVSQFLDQSESLHFDALQAFSLQYLMAADMFLLAAAEAGLFPKPDFSKNYPRTLPFSRITLNCFEKRAYTIRHPRLLISTL